MADIDRKVFALDERTMGKRMAPHEQSSSNCGKLMRSNRPPAKIRSKSFSNRLLIDFFNPNLLLKSIKIVATIQIRTQILILNLIYIKNWSKNDYYRPKMTIFDQNWQFSIKFDQFFDIN